VVANNQALIDGPTTSVPRQAIAYRHLILTPYTITTLPRAAGSGAIKKAFEKAQVVEKWEASSWAKKLAARQSRKVSQDERTTAAINLVNPCLNTPETLVDMLYSYILLGQS